MLVKASESLRDTKYFYGSSKSVAVQLRDCWLREHPDRVSISDSIEEYSRFLREPSSRYKCGYPLVYPYNSGSKNWKANLPVLIETVCYPDVDPIFSRIVESRYKQSHDKLDKSTKTALIARKVLIKHSVDLTARDFLIAQFTGNKSKASMLYQRRGGWYFDPVIFMSIDGFIRKARLGVTLLRDHAYFRYPDKSRFCPHCGDPHSENLAHFFIECPTYRSKRVLLFAALSLLIPDTVIDRENFYLILGLSSYWNDREWREDLDKIG